VSSTLNHIKVYFIIEHDVTKFVSYLVVSLLSSTNKENPHNITEIMLESYSFK